LEQMEIGLSQFVPESLEIVPESLEHLNMNAKIVLVVVLVVVEKLSTKIIIIMRYTHSRFFDPSTRVY
jgi:hypothetical protein